GRGRHTRFSRDWSSDVCSSDLTATVNAKTIHATSIGSRSRLRSSLKPRCRTLAARTSTLLLLDQGHAKADEHGNRDQEWDERFPKVRKIERRGKGVPRYGQEARGR